MKTLLDLANDLTKYAANLPKQVSGCAVKVATVIHHDLTDVTPVDTSTALSNWDISLNEPALGAHEPYFMGKHGSTELASERKANQTAEEILKDKKPGETIFISNDVNYIFELNEGSSSQEPAGFVERAILLGQLELNKFKLNEEL